MSEADMEKGDDVQILSAEIFAKLSSSWLVQCKFNWELRLVLLSLWDHPPHPGKFKFKSNWSGVKGKVGLLNKYNKTRCLAIH